MIKLKASEVRFWQEVYCAVIAVPSAERWEAVKAADGAVEALRKRIEVVEPIPGRL